jgi:hypothetical protein
MKFFHPLADENFFLRFFSITLKGKSLNGTNLINTPLLNTLKIIFEGKNIFSDKIYCTHTHHITHIKFA